MSVYGADKRHHTLTVLVENKSGVLARVAGLFSRRGYNIFSLAVAPTDDERFSRITIVVDVESSPLEQIINQLDKLIPVVVDHRARSCDAPGSASSCWPPSRPDPRPGARSSSWSACSRERSSTSGSTGSR